MKRAIYILAAVSIGACGAEPDPAQGKTPVVVNQTPNTPAATAGAASPPPQQPTMNEPAPPPPTMAAAGSAAPPVMPPPTTMAGAAAPPTTMEPQKPVLAMDECDLNTNFLGDEYCINPPPPDKGFQMHIGPTDYNNPDPRYVLEPGEEVTENFPVTAGNTSDVYYYWRQYRMRPGSHHLIINNGTRRLGGSSNSAKDNPEAGIIAPENMGVGMPLSARAQLSNSFHTFNFTDKPTLKEAWVNFWYRDKADVTEPTREVFSMLTMGILPGQHVLKHGTCNITGSGRLLSVYGHVHANNKGFKVWRTRGGNKMLIHQAFDWEHPGISEYSSIVMNPALDPMAKIDGGYSGIVDLMPGDKVEFECDIVNNTDSIFLGLNEAENDEMCIMIGDTVGASIPPGCSSADLPAGN